MKNISAATGDLEGYICSVQRFSERKISSSDCSTENRRYILENLGSTLGKSLTT